MHVNRNVNVCLVTLARTASSRSFLFVRLVFCTHVFPGQIKWCAGPLLRRLGPRINIDPFGLCLGETNRAASEVHLHGFGVWDYTLTRRLHSFCQAFSRGPSGIDQSLQPTVFQNF
jgi:hypothetical protein